METVAKRGKGRPNLFGKNNENTGAIVESIMKHEEITPYYVQKLMDMGYLEIRVTDKGQDFIKHHAK